MTRLLTMVSSILSGSRRSANISPSHVTSGLRGDKANEKCHNALKKGSEINVISQVICRFYIL